MRTPLEVAAVKGTRLLVKLEGGGKEMKDLLGEGFVAVASNRGSRLHGRGKGATVGEEGWVSGVNSTDGRHQMFQDAEDGQRQRDQDQPSK